MLFNENAMKSLIREAIREEIKQHETQEFKYMGYADVKQFIEISGISKRDMEDRVIPHPLFKNCVCRFDGGTKRYIHIQEGLQAINNILRKEAS